MTRTRSPFASLASTRCHVVCVLLAACAPAGSSGWDESPDGSLGDGGGAGSYDAGQDTSSGQGEGPESGGSDVGDAAAHGEAGHTSGAVGDGGADGASGDGALPANPALGGCPLFAADYAYNVPVDTAPLDPNSAGYIGFMGAPDGGADFGPCTNYGYDFGVGASGSTILNVVPATQPSVAVNLGSVHPHLTGWDAKDVFSTNLGDEVPVPPNANIQSTSDHHMIVVQQDVCEAYEFWDTTQAPDGSVSAYIGVVWNLRGDPAPPVGYGASTSGGTPLVEGMIWYDEVTSGVIDHAIDFIVPVNVVSHTVCAPPATRSEGNCLASSSTNAFPYGGRIRLKKGFDASSFGPQSSVVIAALKKYGAILTDVGCCFEMRQEGGRPWNSSDMNALNSLSIDDFEVPQLPPLVTSSFGTSCENAGCQ